PGDQAFGRQRGGYAALVQVDEFADGRGGDAGVGQGGGGLRVDARLGQVAQDQTPLLELAVGGLDGCPERVVGREFVQHHIVDVALAGELADIDDAGAALVVGLFEPVATGQAAAVGAAHQRQAGFAAAQFGGRRDEFRQDEGAQHQRSRQQPQGHQQPQAADARGPQDGEFVALRQPRKRQDRADQQADGQQLVQVVGDVQSLQVEQVQQGQALADLVQPFDEGEEQEEAHERHQDDGGRTVDFACDV